MATGQPRAGSAPEPPGSTTLVRVTLLAGPVLSMVDSSVVNVAVPVIVRDLHTSLGTAAWTVSGYLLGLAGGLAVSPWLARRFGTMRAYTAVLLGFTLASAACALAPDVGLLITMRVVQGLVGAPMVPLALGLLLGEDGEAANIPVSAGIGPSRTGVRSRGRELYLPPFVIVRGQSQVRCAEHDRLLWPEPAVVHDAEECHQPGT